ncbi:MAG: SAVED domain-containing protein [Fimbriimonadaceae bacterium]|nr:SAVED domain-containing protein [Fimbriimonadaceae bacterium]
MARPGIAPPATLPAYRGGCSLKKLFLSHFSGDATEVFHLADELRLRGIVPWVDKQGGFLVGDANADEARRAIRNDCLGCLLYATPKVFDRPFIAAVEIPAAITQHRSDPTYILFAVPRALRFAELEARSRSAFGFNFADHHCIPVDDAALESGLARVAREVLEKVACGHHPRKADQIRLQFSTREVLPSTDDELLTIDGCSAYGTQNPTRWVNLVSALQDVKAVIAKVHGRPRIIVEGSKHNTSAFLFGRVFQSFELAIRQTPTEYWASTGPATAPHVQVAEEVRGSDALIVTVASRFKNLREDAVLAANETQPSLLEFRPACSPLELEAYTTRGFVSAIYAELDRVVAKVRPSRLHLFMAAPQAVAMQLGQKFAGMPPTYIYDWNGASYEPGRLVPAGVL